MKYSKSAIGQLSFLEQYFLVPRITHLQDQVTELHLGIATTTGYHGVMNTQQAIQTVATARVWITATVYTVPTCRKFPDTRLNP